MYLPFFGLKQAPFSIAPDPRYLFLSERHREALAHLLYGLQGGGGFVLLSGDIGAGKTTVCRGFLEQVPADTRVAYIFNPKLDALELLRTICDEFGIAVRAPGPGAASLKDHIDALNAYLLAVHASGGRSVLVIDEAQNLSPDVLEQLRLLTNLETSERKLLQIILIGQPELRSMLARPELEQLAQRVIARYHLGALSPAETSRYVAHRLAVAGREGEPPFDDAALQRLHALSGGVPRRINLLADRALLAAYAQGRAQASVALVEQAAREVFDAAALPRAARRWRGWQPGLLALALLGLGGWGGAWWAGRHGVSPGAGGIARVSPSPGAQASAAASRNGSGPGVSGPAVAIQAAASAASAASAPAAAASTTEGVVTQDPPAAPVHDEAAAWRDLAGAWGVTLPPGADPCEAARSGSPLQCARLPWPLPMIRELDRPGLMALRDDQGHLRWPRLLALDAHAAVLQDGTQRQRLDLAALGRAWTGDFATFWRAPPGYSAPLTAGQHGPAVDALAAELARWAGVSPPPPGTAMDAALVARLQAFQRARGLAADGVAGPATFMQLNRAVGVEEPHLGEPLAAAAP